MFTKLMEINAQTWVALAMMAVLGAVMLITRRDARRLSIRVLAHGALSITLAFVLSSIRLFRMPQGGSITPASMLPMIAFAFTYGQGPGMLAGLAYGLLQFLQDAYIIHPMQAILDYPLAFAMMGLSGFARPLQDKNWGMLVGVCLSALGCYVCAVLSGVVFFASYAPEGQSPLLYSLGYNIAYLGPDALICALLCAIPAVRSALRRVYAPLRA